MFVLDGINIRREVVGSKVVFTSPDVQGLFVALKPEDEGRANDSIRSALAMLKRMERQRGAVHAVQQVRGERLYA